MHPHRLGDQRALLAAHVIQVTGQVDAAEHRPAEGEGDLVVGERRLRVGPVGGLLRGDGGRGRRRDRRVAERVLLVAGRLQLETGQQRVVDAHPARAAVLEHQAGVPVEDGVQPVELRPVGLEQPRPRAQAAAVGTRRDLDVVVQLEISDAEVADHEVHHLVQVLHRRRVPEVEVVPAVLGHQPAVPLEERLGRQLGDDRAVHADYLGFEPQAGNHARRPDRVKHLADAAGEPGGGRLPRADRVPPALVEVGVPAGIDAEVLRADLGRGVNQREQPLRGRVAHQRVHVVVEDHRQPPGVLVRAADRAADRGQGGDGPLEPVRADGHRGRHRRERAARRQRDVPGVLGVGRAEQRHVGAAGRPGGRVAAVRAGAGRGIPVRALPRLPVPAAVVLDLPGPRVAGGPADDRAHRQVDPGRPRARAGQAESAARIGPVDVPVEVGQRIAEPSALPAPFRQPVVLGPQQVEVVEVVGSAGGSAVGGRARQAAAQERRHRLDRHRRGAGVGQAHPAAQRAAAGQHAVEHLSPQPASRVGQVHPQLAPAPGQVGAVVTDVAEPSPGLRFAVAVAGPGLSLAREDHVEQRQRRVGRLGADVGRLEADAGRQFAGGAGRRFRRVAGGQPDDSRHPVRAHLDPQVQGLVRYADHWFSCARQASLLVARSGSSAYHEG